MLLPPAPPRSPIPCVLLGGLNVARALGLAGIGVWVASTDPAELAFHSRYCIGRTVLPPLSAPREALDALLMLGRKLGRRFGTALPLAFANDEFLRFIYDHREDVQREFRLLLNVPDVAEALIDKNRFSRFAAQLGLPVPAGHAFTELPAVRHAVIVKPRSKIGWEAGMLRHAFEGLAKGAVFSSGPDALAQGWVQRHRDMLLFQEYVPGDDAHLWCYDGVADGHSRVIAGYAGHKVRTSPPGAGESSFIALQRNPELAAIVREIAQGASLRGIFDMDFKRSAANGRYYLLEVNARYNLWLHPAARAGMPLCRVLHEYLLGGDVEPWRDAAPVPYHWLAFDLDRRAWRELAARGELTFPRWARSLAARKVYNVFSWSDPRPYAHFFARRLAHLAAGRVRRWRAAKAE